MNAVDYTAEPQVEGEILHNDGHRALIAKYQDNGGMKLEIYEWREDKRRLDHKGQWGIAMFGTLMVTRVERAALNRAFQ
jgi:hypothetical protein